MWLTTKLAIAHGSELDGSSPHRHTLCAYVCVEETYSSWRSEEQEENAQRTQYLIQQILLEP